MQQTACRWQLQLGDSEKGEFQNQDGSYLWSIPNENNELVNLRIHMLDGKRNVNVYDNGPTGTTSSLNSAYDHTYILADETAQNTKYITILDPHYATEDELQVESLVPGKVWKVIHSEDQYDVFLSQDENEFVSVGELKTDASFAVVSFDPDHEGNFE